MCHSCGGCFHVCQAKAITEIKKTIGVIESGKINGINYAGGQLNIGEPMAPPLIRELKKINNKLIGLRIFDCPPGTSCPVIESIRDCDYLVLVTEPTPFGLNDLKLAVDMAKALNISFGVVINKSDSGDDRVDNFCKQEDIEVLARLPFTREIAEEKEIGLIIIDGSPGSGCPVIATITGASFVLIVTEPTVAGCMTLNVSSNYVGILTFDQRFV